METRKGKERGLGRQDYNFILDTDEHNTACCNGFATEGKRGAYGCFRLPEGVVLRRHSRGYAERLPACFERLRFERTVYPTMNISIFNFLWCVDRKRSAHGEP